MFTAFIALCAIAAALAIAWCMTRHYGRKDKPVAAKGRE